MLVFLCQNVALHKITVYYSVAILYLKAALLNHRLNHKDTHLKSNVLVSGQAI